MPVADNAGSLRYELSGTSAVLVQYGASYFCNRTAEGSRINSAQKSELYQWAEIVPVEPGIASHRHGAESTLTFHCFLRIKY